MTKKLLTEMLNKQVHSYTCNLMKTVTYMVLLWVLQYKYLQLLLINVKNEGLCFKLSTSKYVQSFYTGLKSYQQDFFLFK